MSYQNPSQPQEVRTRMQADYDRYMKGEDRFPRLRLDKTATPELFPSKTQRLVGLLMLEWAIIHEDREVFEAQTLSTITRMQNPEKHVAAGDHNLVITKVGRNAVSLAELTAGESIIDGKREVSASIGQYDRVEFLDVFDGHEFQISDGRTVRIEDGQIVGDEPDGLIVRSTNASGIYIAHPDDIPVPA